MKNIRKLLLLIFIFPSVFPAFSNTIGPEEVNKMILEALGSGNATELSNHFNSMIDMGIAGTQDVYSKSQATRILKDFFGKNPVKSVKILKQGTSNDGSQFSIGEIVAGTKTYRLYYLLKKISTQYLIQQLQIEEDN
jgi:hypothetical protein